MCDLAGSRVNGVTLPPDVIITDRKPDLVIIDRSSNKVNLVKLTVPWDSGTEGAKQRKEERYDSLVEDIKEKGFKCSHTTLEIGSRGLITQRNKSTLIWLCNLVKERKISNVISNCSKLALLGSYSLWVARHSKDWIPGLSYNPNYNTMLYLRVCITTPCFI